MLLAAAGDAVPEAEVATAVQNPRTEAALTIDLVLYARSRGHSAKFYSGDVPRLQEMLAHGQPALLLLDLSASLPMGLGPKHLWHYVLAYGFSMTKRRVYVHSGVGPKYLTQDELLRLWRPGGSWMMTIERRADARRPVEGRS